KGITSRTAYPRANGVVALYLDYCRHGERMNEYLKLYLVPEETREDRAKNRETLRLAETVRAKRVLEVQARAFGLEEEVQGDALFFDVVRSIVSRKTGATRDSWLNFLAHVRRYAGNEGLRMGDVTRRWVQGFRDYLDRKAIRGAVNGKKRGGEQGFRGYLDKEAIRGAVNGKKRGGEPIAECTKALLFQKLCAVFNMAQREGIVRTNPTAGVERFRMVTGERAFLTQEEVRRLAKVPAPNEALGRAFLFSCQTGLRWSDVAKLRWGDVQVWNGRLRIVFRQQKTGGLEYLDVNGQAGKLMGARGRADGLVFEGMGGRHASSVSIAAWVRAAGIDKHITFHCARHTFAVMMLDLGVDLYTVSKLLGHRSIVATQIYAKILDKNKREAVERIPDILGEDSVGRV
ncbi:MAG: site-specific integrase, partial [Rothia sp. (in: high G+C Gram-positive bacteria)]|uniref:site-specific integrase n=1 Tax=Rothia sp. (in: high G+C Gram-positive bacteria) TaxID=1885016 RepID=UPI0026DF1532